MKRFTAIAAAAAACAAGAVPAAASSLPARLDAARAASGTPGAAAAVIRNGRLAWTGASGRLGLAPAPALRRSDRFVLASVTKMFVAAMTVRLAQLGRLRLDSPISGYLPEIPNGDRITVRMLLSHTSGLHEYDDDPAIERALEDPSHRWSRDELIRAVARLKPIFAPGARYEYTNANYVLLGRVIERASGAPGMEAALQRLISRPLHLRSVSFASRLPGFRVARGAEPGDSGRLEDLSAGGTPTSDAIGPVWTDGGIAADAADVARFTDRLYRGAWIAPSWVAQMTRPVKDPGYGLGTVVYNGTYGHDGAYGGYSTWTAYDPARRVAWAVLANRLDDNEPGWAIGSRLSGWK